MQTPIPDYVSFSTGLCITPVMDTADYPFGNRTSSWSASHSRDAHPSDQPRFSFPSLLTVQTATPHSSAIPPVISAMTHLSRS